MPSQSSGATGPAWFDNRMKGYDMNGFELPARPLPPRARYAPMPRRRGLMAYLGLIRQRNELARLDERMLRDIGVTPEEAGREASRPVWDVPSHWLR